MKRVKQPSPVYKTEDVFAAACYADRMNNGEYLKVPSLDEKNNPRTTNRDLMFKALADTSLIQDVDRDAGEAVRRYYHTLTFKVLKGIRLNEFDNNAMLIANKEAISGNYDLAITASLPSCHRRAQVREQADAKVAFARGGLIGSVGDKITAKVEVTKAVFSQQWGVFFLTAITDQDQPVFFAYKKQVAVGTMLKIQGTVKAHRDNTTQLNRVKVL